MAKFFDEQGNEVEAYTEEELEAKKKEALDEYAKQNPDKAEELEKAQKDLEDAQKKLKEYEETGGGDDHQKQRLKDKAKTAEQALEEVRENFTKEIKELKEGFLSGHRTRILDRLSGGDEEVKKKIEFEADQFVGDVKNEVELEQRLTKAATIVNAQTPIPNFTDNLSGAGSRGDKQTHEVSTQESENSKTMRKALGITDEDAEKYGEGAGEKKEA